MIYTALTIGPIYKTLRNAKKTREIWGGSYFFSFFMKEVIKKLLKKGIKEDDIVAPYVEESIFKEKNGVGLFHDRLIVKGDIEEKLKEAINEVIKEIEKESDKKITKKFLENYLQIHIVKKEASNPLLEINPYLDVAELFFKTQKAPKNELLEFIRNNLRNSFLEKDAFDKNRFESLPEIALSCVIKNKDFIRKKLRKYDDKEEEVFNDSEIKEKLPKNANYYKYIALVQADGDNMGRVIEDIGSDEEKLKEFSKTLFKFCKEATEKVESFGGRMIYAGGDDLFFFAPVLYTEKHTIFQLCEDLERDECTEEEVEFEEKNTIFQLCEDLSRDFNERIEKLDLENKPTLSFGVGITYYKFPLYEARENAVNLLFNKAKKKKNAIAFEIIKHSGQSFEGIVYKDNKVFDKFLEIVSFNEKFDSNFLHSIYSKLLLYKVVFERIMGDEKRLKNFFKNNFNENYKEYESFFNELIEFILLINDSKIDDKFNFLYSSLRVKKFLLGDKQ